MKNNQTKTNKEKIMEKQTRYERGEYYELDNCGYLSRFVGITKAGILWFLHSTDNSWKQAVKYKTMCSAFDRIK
jgi:hypothetical protein